MTDATGVSAVQRYEIFTCSLDGTIDPRKSDCGDWVLHYDYAALAERLTCTESELNEAQIHKRRAEDDRDEWDRHLHIERREHRQAIDERDALAERLKACELEPGTERAINQHVKSMQSEIDQLTADLERARAEVARLKREVAMARHEREQAKMGQDSADRSNARLRAAVEFYANDCNYDYDGVGPSAIELDCGGKAQAALTETTTVVNNPEKLIESNQRWRAALVEIGNFAKAHHLEQEPDSHIWLHALIVDIPDMVERTLAEQEGQ